MIIRNVFVFNGDKVYQNYSDNNVYIRNKVDNTLWTSVNSNIDFEYEETNIPIEEVEETREL